jgi:chorismate dehydratase
MIDITAVSYINTLPFIYGIKHSPFLNPDEYTLNTVMPSLCAQAYLSGKADIVLMPSGTVNQYMPESIIDGYCIGAYKQVKSVVVFSEKPLTQVSQLYLDYQSTTSVRLIKILNQHWWKCQLDFIPSETGYEQKIKGDTAGLVIGDRALALYNEFPFVYDLSEEWWKLTQLPFVFAYWVKTKPLHSDFLERFQKALAWGVLHRSESLTLLPEQNNNDSIEYLKNNISFELDDAKINALKLFYTLNKG